ncbi:WYL domain-containing protein (plasmid) [Paenibacillus sp. EC2-1]|uniref:WYL domain-containing protein n=1 Tax=Paenibacillus sp. EC2-1 TaxID=3388665 RepID=UPI003BEEBF1C
MRIIADNKEEYKLMAKLQKMINGMYQQEENHAIKNVYNVIRKANIEKSYVQPGKSVEEAESDIEMYTEDKELIMAYIVTAAVNRKKLIIDYVGKDGKQSQRTIEPFSIKNGMIVSWCHEAGSWRHFKPANIQRIATTTQDFERDEIVEIVPTDAKKYAFLASVS